MDYDSVSKYIMEVYLKWIIYIKIHTHTHVVMMHNTPNVPT